MVTAELAVGLPVLVLAGLLAVAGIQVVTAQLRCLDAAGIAARMAARDEPAAAVAAAAQSAAPARARVQLSRQGDVVVAVVTTAVRPLGLGRLLPAFAVHASAAEADEPGPTP